MYILELLLFFVYATHCGWRKIISRKPSIRVDIFSFTLFKRNGPKERNREDLVLFQKAK